MNTQFAINIISVYAPFYLFRCFSLRHGNKVNDRTLSQASDWLIQVRVSHMGRRMKDVQRLLITDGHMWHQIGVYYGLYIVFFIQVGKSVQTYLSSFHLLSPLTTLRLY